MARKEIKTFYMDKETQAIIDDYEFECLQIRRKYMVSSYICRAIKLYALNRKKVEQKEKHQTLLTAINEFEGTLPEGYRVDYRVDLPAELEGFSKKSVEEQGEIKMKLLKAKAVDEFGRPYDELSDKQRLKCFAMVLRDHPAIEIDPIPAEVFEEG